MEVQAPSREHPRDPVDRSGYARQRREKTMAEPPRGNELMDASQRRSAPRSSASDDLQKMAESNKAFAHYRW